MVVGTPGRLRELQASRHLSLAGAKAFVLDEADRLLDAMYGDVAALYEGLPKRKQVLAFSATFTPELTALLLPMCKRPQRINLCEESVSLAGIRQLYARLDGAGGAGALLQRKAAALLGLLRSLKFNQVKG